MDVCDEEFHVTTDHLRACRPRPRIKATTSPIFQERHTALGLISSIMDDGDNEACDFEHDSSRDDENPQDVIKSHDFRITKQRKKSVVDIVNDVKGTGRSNADSHELKLSGKAMKSRKSRLISTPNTSTTVASPVSSGQSFCLSTPQSQQPRNYRVVHITSDGSSQKSLKLTLRAASPKEETKFSTPVNIPVTDSDLPPMVTPNSYQHFVSQHNNIISTPLNIDTGDESSSASSASSSSSQSSTSFYEGYFHPKRTRRRGVTARDRWSVAVEKTKRSSRSSVDETKSLTLGGNITTTINNNISTDVVTTSTAVAPTTNVVSTVNSSRMCVNKQISEKLNEDKGKSVRISSEVKPQTRSTPALPPRKGRSAVTTAMKTPATSRRANGKRSLSSGPMLNGYGVPASIESMSSLKEYINYDNFISLPEEMQRELMTLLPSTDCVHEDTGNVGINPSALKNEYFTKSLDEYLDKGYRAAAMKSQRYPLSTGHNTRQRRRNEDTGVDLSPKDEWKKTYFETYWGEKSALGSSFEKSSTDNSSLSANCATQNGSEMDSSLQLKQPVVKLTRTDSVGEQAEELLLKEIVKSEEDSTLTENELPDSHENSDPVALNQALSVSHTPNSRSNLTQNIASGMSRSRSGKWQRLRKRDQRTSEDSSLATSILSQNESILSGGGARKRRRKQSIIETSPIPLSRETNLCGLSVTASALSLVDDQGKTNSNKSGSSSGPSNNSSSSPSTYGETSPQTEELGGHPSEFIKPRPPPPQTSGVAAVAAAAAANVSLSTNSREKTYTGSGHHFISSVTQSRLSRLNGKTVGELRRDISYRLMTVSQRVNTIGNPIVSAASTVPNASLSPLPLPASGTTIVSLTPFIKGIPSASYHPNPVLNSQWPRGRKYALAARTFERQLQQKKKEKEDENCGLSRSKRSHMIRLRRLQACNARRALEQHSCCNSIKTEESVPPSSCPSSTSQVDSCHLSGDWTPGNAKDTTCASSSTSASTLTSGSSANSTKPSTGVVRTRDGSSIVFRDKLCPATLANVCKRLPGADVRLSFGLPEDLLPRLHEELADVCTSSEPQPGPRLQLQWNVNSDTRVVNLSFLEAPTEVKVEKKEDSHASRELKIEPSTLSSSGAPEPPQSPFPSPCGDRVIENHLSEPSESSSASQLLTCPNTSWSSPSSHQPSSSPTSTANISAAHDTETVLSPVVDDFLNDTQEKKYFRMKRRVLLE